MTNGMEFEARESISFPRSGFDITRGAVPILLVIALVGAAMTASWKVSAYVQADTSERTVILTRLDKIEGKLDRALRGSQVAARRRK